MSDDETPKKRSAFRPKMPRFRRGALRLNDEYANLRQAISGVRHVCPRDHTPMDLLDVFPTDESGEVPAGAEPVRSLVCPECGYTIRISDMIDQLRVDAQPLKKAENTHLIFGIAIIVLFGIIFALNGSILTIIGALIFAVMLFLKALFYRYRHWQLSTGRLFEANAPVKAWLQEEWSSR